MGGIGITLDLCASLCGGMGINISCSALDMAYAGVLTSASVVIGLSQPGLNRDGLPFSATGFGKVKVEADIFWSCRHWQS